MNHSNGDMKIEKTPMGEYRVLSHDSDEQGSFVEEVAVCYRLDNARLAAAAPALREAALQALDALEMLDRVMQRSPRIDAAIAALRAALASA